MVRIRPGSSSTSKGSECRSRDAFEDDPKIVQAGSGGFEVVDFGRAIGDEEDLKNGDEYDLDILVKTVNNLTRMHEALAFLDDTSIPMEVKQKAVMKQNKHGVTALFWAVRRNADFKLIEKMVDIGGEDLVKLYNTYDENALHNAAFCGNSYEVFKLLIDVGGEGAIFKQDVLGNTPLHYSCAWGASETTIRYMINKGGPKLLMTKNNMDVVPRSDKPFTQELLLDHMGGEEYKKQIVAQKEYTMSFFDLIRLNMTEEVELKLDSVNSHKEVFETGGNGLNCLMMAIWFIGNSSSRFESSLSSMIRKMVQIGGKDLVLTTNETNSNALHYAAFNGAPLDVIVTLMNAAGSAGIEKVNNWGSTPLHDACLRQAEVEIVEYLIKHGGRKALLAKNRGGQKPLELLYDADIPSDEHIMTMHCAWFALDPYCAQALSRKLFHKTLLWADNADPKYVTANNFVKDILNHRFILPRYQTILFTDLYVQLAVVLVISPQCLFDFYMDQDSDITIWIVILCFCVAWFIGRELIELLSSPLQSYSKSYDNFLDLLQIALLVWTIQLLSKVQFSNDQSLQGESPMYRGVLVSTTFVASVQMLFVIGQLNYSVSVFTYAVAQIISQLAPFLLTASLVVLAFGQMFFIAGTGSESCRNDFDSTEPKEWQCGAASSFFQSFAMLLTTDYMFMDWESVSQPSGNGAVMSLPWLSMISFLFATIVGILLLNILIAVVSNVFTKVSEESENAFWTTRLDIMVEVNMIRNFVLNITNQSTKRKQDQKKKENSQEIDNTKVRKDDELKKIKVRKDFAQYDDDWMHYKCKKIHLDLFYNWWYYSWKKERPQFRTRMWYFYNHATMNEIFFPGKVYQNMLFGKKYNEKLVGTKACIALIISVIHLFFGLVVAIIMFILGLVSWGYAWPKAMKETLFHGPLGSDCDLDDRKGKGVKSSLSTRAEKAHISKVDRLEQQMSDLRFQNAILKQQNEKIITLLQK